MVRRKWFVSTLFFLISVGFLIFSKAFFSRTVVSESLTSLPAAQSNVVLLANNDYYPYLRTHFQNAQKKIVGTIYLFKTSSYRKNEPADLLRELIAARKRNVGVEVVIDLSGDDGESRTANLNAGHTLREAGVTVRYDREDVATHAKTFVIDDRYCFVGSHNFTHAGMSRNEEVSVFIDSPEIARKLTDFIHQIPLSN
jgi:phosphatidylserine/phosphatidylglycerophosphate/cardiolipin synthase-like enzyme